MYLSDVTYLGAVLASVGRRTLAGVRVDAVDTLGAVLAEVTGTVVCVVLAVLPSKPCRGREEVVRSDYREIKAQKGKRRVM